MGLLTDLNKFLEDRLEEFLKANPHLELQMLLEQLQDQEKDTIRLILELQTQEQQAQQKILTLAEQIQTWHTRIAKAKAAGRMDLAKAAADQEAALLQEGNQVWGQMQGYRDRLTKARELQQQIQQRSIEVADKLKHMPASQTVQGQRSTQQVNDLEQKFRDWETQLELEDMKRKMGR
jgi:uncharacterized protein (TIGR04376 family)